MRTTRAALVGGVVVLGLFCVLAAIGSTQIREVLVALAALVVLVGGGNWLAGRTSRQAGPAARPAGRAEEAGAMQCPMEPWARAAQETGPGPSRPPGPVGAPPAASPGGP